MDGAGPQRGRKDGPPDSYLGPLNLLGSPFFFGFQKPFFFQQGKRNGFCRPRKVRTAASSQVSHPFALPSWAGLARSTVRPFPTRLVSLVGFPRLSGISHSASLLVLSPRRHKLRVPHPAASGRLRSLRCSGSPGKRHSAFCRVPILLRWARAGAPFLHVV